MYHLFVATAFQRQGLSRQIWRFALQNTALPHSKNIVFTLNSSLYAQAVYEKLGFKATGFEVESNGIVFIPMSLEFKYKNTDQL